jgi:hypothetical protein
VYLKLKLKKKRSEHVYYISIMYIGYILNEFEYMYCYLLQLVYIEYYMDQDRKNLSFQIGSSKGNAIKTLLSVAIKRGVSVAGRFRFYYLPRKKNITRLGI